MEDPEARRERLKRLREQVQGDEGTNDKPDQGLNPGLQFKNYRPRDDIIAAKQVGYFVAGKVRLLVNGACQS